MILVDTSIWIDHLRRGDRGLARLLQAGHVLAHWCVIGELAMGELTRRTEVLGLLADLPQATSATADEVMVLIETRRLFGLGLGHLDAHLLAATLLTAGARLWTRDRRLAACASELGIATGKPSDPR